MNSNKSDHFRETVNLINEKYFIWPELKYLTSFLSYLACLKEGSFFKHYLNFYMKNVNLKNMCSWENVKMKLFGISETNILDKKCQHEMFRHFEKCLPFLNLKLYKI